MKKRTVSLLALLLLIAQLVSCVRRPVSSSTAGTSDSTSSSSTTSSSTSSSSTTTSSSSSTSATGTTNGLGPGESTTLPEYSDEKVEYLVCINEVCAKNNTSIAAPDGEYYDYVELYNPGNFPVNLEGFGLSDDPGKPYQSKLPAVILNPDEHLLCFAVGDQAIESITDTTYVYLKFKISTAGETILLTTPKEVTDPNMNPRETVDSVTVPTLGDDICYGRVEDGSWSMATLSPTPNRTNHGSSLDLLKLEPTFSRDSGFYLEPFMLSVEVPEGCTMYYTLNDCTDPRTSGTAKVYSAPLEIKDATSNPNTFSKITVTAKASSMYHPDVNIDKATVVRYVLKDAEGRYTETGTKVYFVDFQNKIGYQNMNVVSIVTTPSNLYDNETGIFVNGNWNGRGKEYEREVSFTLFDPTGKIIVSQNLGVRVQGASSRGAQQKNMNLFARSEYGGQNYFEDPIFEGVGRLKSVLLRNDREYKFGERFMMGLVEDREVDTQPSIPCVVFLEGEYYGIYNMYVKLSTNSLADKYGVNKDDIAIIKKGQLEDGLDSDLKDYNDLLNYIKNHDLSDPDHYAYVADRLDIQSYIDYVCAQIYLANVDWSMKQNFAVWRTRTVNPKKEYADGKWRCVLYDMDFAIGYTNKKYDHTQNYFTYVQPYTKVAAWSQNNTILWGLKDNPMFIEQFALTFMDMANVNFNADKANTELNALLNLYAPNIVKYYQRYDGYSSSGAARDEKSYWQRVAYFPTFFTERYTYAVTHLKEQLGITTDLEYLTVSKSAGGSLLVNTTCPTEENNKRVSLKYFGGQFMTVRAVAEEGYRFVGWEVSGITVTDLTADTLYFTMPDGTVNVRAIFEPIES